jgi:hypothetical protein
MGEYQGEIYMPDVRADLIDLIWDLHKDARNFKPDRIWREDIALGVVAPTPDVKLEPWEIWEARAELAGFGA